MAKIRPADLRTALAKAGVRSGGVVFVQSDLRALGLVEAPRSREGILEFYYSAFRELLGPDGTLCVLTSFEDWARYGVPFDCENSPSRAGVFSEYVRTRPGAVRSVHPIASITAIGPRAEEISGGPHGDGFGYDSPYARLHRLNARLIGLGFLGFTFNHYVEKLYGVPYQYTKLFRYPVFKNGEVVPGPFTMSVRYLDFGIVNTPVRIRQHLLDAGHAVLVPLGTGHVLGTDLAVFVEEGIKCLRRDRYFFLEQPPRFRAGEIPTDGPPGAMQIAYDKGDGAGTDGRGAPPGE